MSDNQRSVKFGEDEYGRWRWDRVEKVAIEPHPFLRGPTDLWHKLIARYWIVRWHLAADKCYDREFPQP
jgi:hypothetical protein